MDDISKELSISKKTIYQFFKDKNEIVEHIIKYHLDSQNKVFSEIRGGNGNAIEKLHKIGQFLRDSQKKVNPLLVLDIRKYYPDIWKGILEFKECVIHHTLVNIINSGIKEGYFRNDINADILATLRQSELDMIADDDLFPEEEFDIGVVHLQLFEHFLHGIMTEKGMKEFSKYINNNVIQ